MIRGLALIALLFLVPASAGAHPEMGFLPDEVAEMEYKIVLDLNPGDTVTRNKLGIVLLRKSRPSEASREFSKVLKASPDDFDALDGMGLVKLMEGNYEEAAVWFKKAISVKAEDTMVHYHLGLAYERSEKLAEAESAYQKALEVSRELMLDGADKKAELSKSDFISAVLVELYAKKGR